MDIGEILGSIILGLIVIVIIIRIVQAVFFR